MTSINSLLNQDAQQQADQHTRPGHFIPPTTYDAADALATLATLGSGQQYISRELPSPTAFAHPPRRTSSFSSHHAAPVEPSPPIEQPPTHSPTLEQYHHGSKSPEAQRRQSLALARSSPAPILAPIQDRSMALQDRISEEPASHGHDASQLVSPPTHAGDDDVGRDETQQREPAYVRDEPTTSQIRAPESPSPGTELPVVKDERPETPHDALSSTALTQSVEQHQPSTQEAMDTDTLKAIEIAKQSDLGLRTKRNPSVAESVTSPTEQSKPAPSKKRPAPAGASGIKKKGTATAKKPPSKRRKLDAEGEGHARSGTPTLKKSSSKSGKKGSQAGTPAAESSPAPDHSSQVHPTDDEGESSEDNALYCICRKPDNHRWMIGCDGGCDDWFHGSCVNMAQADEDLVDRFICPLCEEKGRGQTTYKPMCRRDGCRKPARVTKGTQSKYCSDECGSLFMTEQVQRTAGAKNHKKKNSKKKVGSKPGETADPVSDEDDEPTPLGGVLRAKDLKALIDQAKDIQTFKAFGSGVLSPPRTASPTKASFDGADDPALTAAERQRLTALHNEKSQLKDRLEVLKDREKFVSMIKDQVGRLAEREKMKAKELCGYDSRLSWSDAEFLLWRNSRVGKASFEYMTLEPSEEQLSSLSNGSIKLNGTTADDNDSKMDIDTSPPTSAAPKKSTPPSTLEPDVPISLEAGSICLKKRCQKHAQWQKQNLQDARFEEVEIAESIRECEKEERSVRERAARRGKKDRIAGELRGGDDGNGNGSGKGEERNREGWVERVGG